MHTSVKTVGKCVERVVTLLVTALVAFLAGGGYGSISGFQDV